jgi:putative transposase
MNFKFIKNNHSRFTVKKMCQNLSVSESGYYRWLKVPVSNRAKINAILTCRIVELYEEHNGMVGSPMLTADLRAESKFASVSQKRVARLMKTKGLQCKYVKKFKTTTDSNHKEPIAKNLLNRNFKVSSPNTVWVGDITYLKVGKEWCYLSVFIDLFSRIVVGWDLSATLDRTSTIKAFNKALLRRNPCKGLMVHSDRGIQYASGDFREVLRKNSCIQSMSRKGNCWDNAVAESFFHTLKGQYSNHTHFTDRRSAELGLFNYIEAYYNHRRRHSSNGYKSPMIYEKEMEAAA